MVVRSRRHLPLIFVKEVYLDINERSHVFVLFLGLKILSSQRILWFTHFPSPPISFLCFAIYVRDIFGYLNSQPTCAGHWNRDLMKWSWNILRTKTTSLIDNAMEPITKIDIAFDLCPNSVTYLALKLEFHKCKKWPAVPLEELLHTVVFTNIKIKLGCHNFFDALL